MTTAKSRGRSILMCGNPMDGLNSTAGKDIVVKQVISNLQFFTSVLARRRKRRRVTAIIGFIVIFQTDFEWNDSERASVLGSFYWLHWALQLPGGLLARQFGAKRIFGFSNLFMFVISMLMPMLARWDIKGLIVARALQGFIGVSATLLLFTYR